MVGGEQPESRAGGLRYQQAVERVMPGKLTHRPHRTLKQAAPLRPLPDAVTDLGQFRVQRRDRSGGVLHEYRLVA